MDLISASTLSAKNLTPPPQIVKGCISVGYNILAAPPKAGKSWVSLGLALAVARGTEAFGVLKTKRCPVLYIALEDHEYRLQNRLRMIGGKLAMPENLYFCTYLEKLADKGIEDLHTKMHEHGFGFVIIDTLGKVLDEKKGDLYQEDYMVGAALQDVAFSANAAILGVHHTNKTKGAGIGAVSGTFGVSAAADAVIVMNRTNSEREPPAARLAVTGRDVEDKTVDLEWYPPEGGWVSPRRTKALPPQVYA